MELMLGIFSIVFALGWVVRLVHAEALILYIIGKGYDLPSRNELKACMRAVIEHHLGLDGQD